MDYFVSFALPAEPIQQMAMEEGSIANCVEMRA